MPILLCSALSFLNGLSPYTLPWLAGCTALDKQVSRMLFARFPESAIVIVIFDEVHLHLSNL